MEIADELRRRFVEWSPKTCAFWIFVVEPCGSCANFAPRKPTFQGPDPALSCRNHSDKISVEEL